MGKLTIDLCLLEGAYFGLVLPSRTGFIYTNQTGGTACLHPEVEGTYVPLPVGWFPAHDVMEDLWFDDWREDGQRLLGQFLLEAGEGSTWFKVPGERFWKGGWGEAWLPVEVVLGKSFYDLTPLVGQRGFLVYPNSD